jgi:hypothetical protein
VWGEDRSSDPEADVSLVANAPAAESPPCFFCGRPAGDTKEDIIPKWYQRHHPENHVMYLPNDTWMFMRDAVVPACPEDNGAFGEIEYRISRGTYAQNEAYLWAFKVHAGLAAIDSRLHGNRKDPYSEPLAVLGLAGFWLQQFFNSTVITFRRLYRVWRSKGRFLPAPLGSVLTLDSRTRGHFWFQHAPLGYVGFNLGTRFLAVSLFDGGFGQKQNYAEHWRRRMAGLDLGRFHSPPLEPQLFEGFWMLHMAYTTYLAREWRRIVFTEGDAVVVPEQYMVADLGFEDLLVLEGKQFGLYAIYEKGGDTRPLTVGTRANFLNRFPTR